MQKLFATRYDIPETEWQNTADKTSPDGATFPIGDLQLEVLHFPGHPLDSVGHHTGRNVFTGNCIFNPDLGSARCDFPQGSAAALWKSMQRLLTLSSDYKLYTGHDYPPADRIAGEGTGKPNAYATVEEHRASNRHAKDGTSERTFIDWREQRDAGLAQPRLTDQALHFNIRGGL